MTADKKRFYELVKGFDATMLVTKGTDGVIRSRPMAIAKAEPDMALSFITSLDNNMVDEMLKSPNVCLTMQKERLFMSISGEARVLQDQAQIKKLWSKVNDLWFPNGPETPGIVVVEVEPHEADYWNEKSVTGLKFVMKAIKAVLTHSKVKRSEDEHQHTKL